MRLIKCMGLVVVLALAVGASIGAASASASYFTGGEYPVTLKAPPTLSQQITTEGGVSYQCQNYTLEGFLKAPSESLEADSGPSGLKCASPPTDPEATLSMNGCKLILHPGSELASGYFSGSAEIGPAKCGPMVLKGNRCTRKFAAQTGLSATFTDEGSGAKGTVGIVVSGSLAYTSEGQLSQCGAATGSASYGAAWQMSGYNGFGEAVGAAVVKNPPIGLYMAGKEGSEPRFEAEKYPAKVSGNQNTAAKYTLGLSEGIRPLSCESASLQGTLSAAATQLGLVPEGQNCSLTILGNQDPATIQANSCQYSLNALNVGPPYAGSLGVACSKEGDGIEIKAYASAQKQAEGVVLCAYTIAPQSALKGVSLENIVSGISRGIGVSFGVSGIAYTKTQGTVANCGAKTTVASLSGSGTLLGQ